MDASKLDLDTEVEISWSTSVTITYRTKVALGDMVTAGEFAEVQDHLGFPGSSLTGALEQIEDDDLAGLETSDTQIWYEVNERFIQSVDVTR